MKCTEPSIFVVSLCSQLWFAKSVDSLLFTSITRLCKRYLPLTLQFATLTMRFEVTTCTLVSVLISSVFAQDTQSSSSTNSEPCETIAAQQSDRLGDGMLRELGLADKLC